MRRLEDAGFGREFVSSVILPEWWAPECWSDQDLVPEVELRVARFLGIPVASLVDAATPLRAPVYRGAKLRRVRDIDRDLLGPAIHSALRIAEAVVRNLRSTVAEPDPPPADALKWRTLIERAEERVGLEDILDDLWARGIPVVPIDVLPAPSFQGLAAIVAGRPVIVVGHKHDEPGRAAFRIAHEAGHIAHEDCTADAPVVDEDEEISSEDDMEARADGYALRLLVGGDMIPSITQEESGDYRELAKRAASLEQETGADAGAIIFSWARLTGDYATATMATKSIYRAAGARRSLRERFLRHVDVAGASESDRELLRAVLPDPGSVDAAAG